MDSAGAALPVHAIAAAAAAVDSAAAAAATAAALLPLCRFHELPQAAGLGDARVNPTPCRCNFFLKKKGRFCKVELEALPAAGGAGVDGVGVPESRPTTNPDPVRCNYWVAKKKRFCRMMPAKTSAGGFCAEHDVAPVAAAATAPVKPALITAKRRKIDGGAPASADGDGHAGDGVGHAGDGVGATNAAGGEGGRGGDPGHQSDAGSQADPHADSPAESSAGPARVSGVLIALCCHQCCSWRSYCNREFFSETLGFSEREFKLLCSLSSWAVCGTRTAAGAGAWTDPAGNGKAGNGEATIENDIDDHAEHAARGDGDGDGDGVGSTAKRSGLSKAEQVDLGLCCKRLLDTGRMHYLKQHGFDAKLLTYTDHSLENVLLFAEKADRR